MAAGSWCVPLTLALMRDGVRGFENIPTEAYIFAETPNWLNPDRDKLAFSAVELTSALMAIAGAGILGLVGIRLSLWLTRRKLCWITSEHLPQILPSAPKNALERFVMWAFWIPRDTDTS